MSSQIEIFNRVDTVIQTDVSRASAFYDADNPHRYHVSEIADPNIYDTFFEIDYKNRFFGVVKLISGTPVLLKEFLNYATKKVGDGLTKVLKYCGITDIYP